MTREECLRAKRARRPVPARLFVLLLLLLSSCVADAEMARGSGAKHNLQLRGGGSSNMEEGSISSGSGGPVFMAPSWQAEVDAIKARWRGKAPPSVVVAEPLDAREQQRRVGEEDADSPPKASSSSSSSLPPHLPANETISAETTAATREPDPRREDAGGGGEGAGAAPPRKQQQLTAQEQEEAPDAAADEHEDDGGRCSTSTGMPRIPPVDLDLVMANRIRLLAEVRAAEERYMELEHRQRREGEGAAMLEDRGGRRGGPGKLGIIEEVCTPFFFSPFKLRGSRAQVAVWLLANLGEGRGRLADW